MNVYSEAFFHRTNELYKLCSIIENGFQCFYCKEEIFLGNNKYSYIGIPMVSFCDIPLSHIDSSTYGNLGIAMTREWANQKSLEPVLYYPLNKKCQSTKMVIQAAKVFLTNPKDYDGYRILGYAKPMRRLEKGKKTFKNYAEREWRRVYSSKKLKWLTEESFTVYRNQSGKEKQPVGPLLHFSIDDIVFLIVDQQNKAELQQFIMKKLSKLGGGEINEQMRLDLISKIVVYEDIVHNL